jgi:hypothetical protein
VLQHTRGAAEAQQHDDTPQQQRAVGFKREYQKQDGGGGAEAQEAAFAPSQMIKDQDSHNQWPRRRDNDSQTQP